MTSRILIIDDSPTFRGLIKKVLRPLADDVFTAENGVDGIRQILEHNPSLIALDMNMPQLNGSSLLAIMALLGLSNPCLLVTAQEQAPAALNRFTNVVGWLPKARLEKDLPALAREAMQGSHPFYADFDYILSQQEMLGLLSTRDRRRLLVVEDSDSIRQVIVRSLAKTGYYEVYQATNGHEGLVKAIMLKPDLILSDIEMPIIDGLSMAQILYITGHPLPLAYISALSDQATVEKAKKLKAVRGYFLKKEINQNPKGFLKAVEDFLLLTPAEKDNLQKGYQKFNLNDLMASGQDSNLLAGRT